MKKQDVEALASAYIDHFSEQHAWDKDLVLTKRDASATEWASDKMIDLALENPEDYGTSFRDKSPGNHCQGSE